MSSRTILHVGTPKTGTSFLQDVLYHNRPLLERHGISYPADRFDEQFLAALDLMRLPWGGLENEAAGAWDRVATRVRAWRRTSILSHEILANASRNQIDHALESLGDTEVHLVLSVRDLARQIPAEWQENVKHRRHFTYGSFLEAIRDPQRGSRTAAWFWSVQEIPDILDRWGASLPPERVHLVTVPKPGAPRELLWQRFVTAMGLEDIPLELHDDRSNPSLGAPETTLLRRLNKLVNREISPGDYRPLVRELLAHQTLSRRTTSPRLSVPPDVHAWATGIARDWVAELRARKYDVIGDLDELLPDPDPAPYSDPDRPRWSQVTDAALDAIRALLVENARQRHEIGELRGELDSVRARLTDTERALERSYLRPSYRLREKAVERLESKASGQRVMRVYRKARGRT